MTVEQETEKYKEITPIAPSAELHGLINAARNKIELDTPTPFAIKMPTALSSSDLSLAALLDKKPSDRKAIIKKIIDDTWTELKTELEFQIQNIPNTVANAIIEAIFKLMHELVDQLIQPFDDPIIYVQCAYNNVIRMIRKLMDPNLKEEIRREVTDTLMRIVRELAEQIPFVADIIALILLIESMKRVIATLRDMKEASAENYDDSINSVNTTLEILNQEALLGSNIISMIVTVLNILLPFFALLGAIYCGGKDCDVAIKEVDEKYLQEENDKEDAMTEGSRPEIPSVIEQYAKANIKGFSYKKSTQKEQTEESTERLPLRLGATATLVDDKQDNPPFKWTTDFKEIIYTLSNELGKFPYFYEEDTKKISGFCEISEVTDYGITYKVATTIPEDEDFCHDDIEYMDMCTDGTSGLGGCDNIADSFDDIPPTNADGSVPAQKIFLEFDPNETRIIKLNKGDSIKYGDYIGNISEVPVYAELSGTVDYVEENFVCVSANQLSGEELEKETDSLVAKALSSDAQVSELDTIIEKFNKLNKVKTIIRDYLGYLRLPYIPLNDGVEVTDDHAPASKDSIYGVYKAMLEMKVKAYQEKVKLITGKDHIELLLKSEKMEELKNEIFEEENKFYADIINHFNYYIKNNSLVCDVNEKKNYLLLTDYEEIFDKIDYDEENEYLMELVLMLEDFIIERREYEGSGKAAYIESFNEFCDGILKSKWTFDKTYYEYFSELQTSYTYEPRNTNSDNVKSSYKKLYGFITDLLDCKEDTNKTYNVTTMEDIKNLSSDATTYIDEDAIQKREDAKKICRRFFLIKDMNEYTEDDSGSSKDRLIRITSNERDRINDYVTRVLSFYYDNKDIVDGTCFDIFKRGVFNKRANVYRNDIQYEHYFITDADHAPQFDYSGELTDEILEALNSEASPKTKMPKAKLPYWLLYCIQATLVHCMLPFYWPCGIMVAGAPVPLPVIYIPIYFLDGPVSVLFGLAICGVFIFPMIVTINLTIDVKCVITFINTILDAIRNNLNQFLNNNKTLMKESIKKRIEDLENDSENLAKELQKIDIQISDIEEQIIFCGLQKEEIKERRRKKKGGD